MIDFVTKLEDFPGKIRMDHSRKHAVMPVGEKIGRLTIVGYAKKDGQLGYVCQCTCGNVITTTGSPLYSGRTRSCGCLSLDKTHKQSITHGGSRSRLYRIWALMLYRCTPGGSSSRHYGDRGITVCDEWRDFSTFREWAVGSGYDAGMTIERKDVDRGYSPENCTWIPRNRQPCNSRRSLRVTIAGVTKCLSDWCREKGVKYHTAVDRLKRGLSVDQLFAPPTSHKGHKPCRKGVRHAIAV